MDVKTDENIDVLKNKEATIKKKLKAYLRNATLNTPLIYAGIDFIDLRNSNVFIVGAGESLNNNIDFLKANKDKIFIIAVDMALRPLMDNGIRPDITFIVETHPTSFFDGLDTRGMMLYAYSISNNCNIRKWRGNVKYFNVVDDSYWLQKIYKRTIFNRIPGLISGGNVLSVAFGYAAFCKAARIVLVGNDLGYQHSLYARGTVRGQYQRTNDRFNTLETQDRRIYHKAKSYPSAIRCRNPVTDIEYFTNESFMTSKRWMEKTIEDNNVKNVLDVSEMGLSRGVEKITLKNA
jgi:hypothetical protein